MQRQNKLNTTVSTVPTTRIFPLENPDDDQGIIPDELAALTLGILRLHQANGDLAWVIDMASDMEKEPNNDSPEYKELLSHLRPAIIDELLEMEGMSGPLTLTLTELRKGLG